MEAGKTIMACFRSSGKWMFGADGLVLGPTARIATPPNGWAAGFGGWSTSELSGRLIAQLRQHDPQVVSGRRDALEVPLDASSLLLEDLEYFIEPLLLAHRTYYTSGYVNFTGLGIGVSVDKSLLSGELLTRFLPSLIFPGATGAVPPPG